MGRTRTRNFRKGMRLMLGKVESGSGREKEIKERDKKKKRENEKAITHKKSTVRKAAFI